MIRWCANCQNYLGEAEPFNKFSISQGLCPKCSESGVAESGDAVERLRPLTDFYTMLRREAREGINYNPKDWVNKAFELGIKPESMLVGLIQPALYEIGELWLTGEVTVFTEHRFSAFAEALIDVIYQYSPELDRSRKSKKPDVLIANADANYHTLGVKFLEISLLSAGLKTHVLLPGLPVSGIIERTKILKPGILGLSISMSSQVKHVTELSDALAKLPAEERPFLLVGGIPFKQGLTLPPELNVSCCRNISDFPLSRVKSRHNGSKETIL